MMARINQAIKKTNKDIQAVADTSYIYFIGLDGENIPSLMLHPKSVGAADRKRIVLEHIQSTWSKA